MKQLRLYCPFHGRKWPLIAAVVAAIAAWAFGIYHNWPEELTRAALLFAPAAVLICSYLFFRRLSPAERELVAHAEFPNWVPATEQVLRRVKDQKQQMGRGVRNLLIYLGIFAVSAALPGRHGEPSFALFAVFLLTGAAVYIADMLLRNRWQSADTSAVMTKVPIDHMYDIVTRYSRRSWRWYLQDADFMERTDSYAVFYQPDGRYVLPVGAGAGYCKSFIIVQYNGMLTWIPYLEP